MLADDKYQYVAIYTVWNIAVHSSCAAKINLCLGMSHHWLEVPDAADNIS
jgi:hypothetical protein